LSEAIAVRNTPIQINIFVVSAKAERVSHPFSFHPGSVPEARLPQGFKIE
jgi:hypothetical protein